MNSRGTAGSTPPRPAPQPGIARPLRIGVACFASDGGRSGIGQYLVNVVRRLPQLAPADQFVLFAAHRDAALWDGTGSSNTIKGILRATGIATGTLDLTDPDSLIDGLATAQGNKVNPSHWVMTAASFAKVRKVKVGTSDKRYVMDPSTIQNGTELRLLGLPVIITDNIPAASTKNRVALVDFSKVVVARDVNAEVKILDQTWGDYDSIGIRVVSRWDTALLQAKAVTLLTEA